MSKRSIICAGIDTGKHKLDVALHGAKPHGRMTEAIHTRPRVQQAPGIPCSLRFRGEGQVHANLGRKCAARMRAHTRSSSPANGSRECAPDDRLRQVIQYSRDSSD
ncbi:hypothetical protein V1293_000433 [Bradyrhizobium sp. AZCC 1693]